MPPSFPHKKKNQEQRNDLKNTQSEFNKYDYILASRIKYTLYIKSKITTKYLEIRA